MFTIGNDPKDFASSTSLMFLSQRDAAVRAALKVLTEFSTNPQKLVGTTLSPSVCFFLNGFPSDSSAGKSAAGLPRSARKVLGKDLPLPRTRNNPKSIHGCPTALFRAPLARELAGSANMFHGS